MGVSTDGQICYGVPFEEDYEFPWDEEDEDDLEGWWRAETGFKYEGEEPYNEEGNYNPGFNEQDPRVAAYFAAQREWLAAHPLPVELVNYQSAEHPAYMLAVVGTSRSASRGYPERFDPSSLTVDPEAAAVLQAFLDRYDLVPEEGVEAGWYLTSYWG